MSAPLTACIVDRTNIPNLQVRFHIYILAGLGLPVTLYAQTPTERPEEGQTAIYQSAIFDLVGLGRLLCWYGVYPLHEIVFAGLLRGLVREALAAQGDRRT